MEQVCLIVDDKDQQHTFKAQIQDILKKEGHNVEIIFINTTSPELLNEEQNIDKDKLKACIKSKIEKGSLKIDYVYFQGALFLWILLYICADGNWIDI